MTEVTDMQHTEEATLLDSATLKTLAGEISEVLFDWGETSTMERKIDDRLLELVSRVLHRCEDRPDQIREAENILMHMEEPYLGIAILRQVFLIKSEPTEQSVVRHLIRLAQSRDRRTAQLTLEALREAAYSETPRLQNVGCQALFQSGLLSEEELREFIRAEEIGFRHRLAAVRHLVESQSALAPAALVDLLTIWGSFRGDEKAKHKNSLFDLARFFDYYGALPSEFVDAIVEELFSAADGHQLDNQQKKVVQTALAALSERTVKYLQMQGPGQSRSISAIYTLGACARRSPTATKVLIERAKEIVDSALGDVSWLLLQIAYKLENATHDGDPSIQHDLDNLIETIEFDSSLADIEEVVVQFRGVKESWQPGKKKKRLSALLRSLAEEFESYPRLDEQDAWDLRHAFERERKPSSATELDRAERAVLIEAMSVTAGTNPWKRSAGWLLREYDAFDGHERLVIQDVLGNVALGEKGVVETKEFRKLQRFFEGLVQHGSPAEKQYAGEWLDRLVGERLPGAA